jgi:hypothetical protein
MGAMGGPDSQMLNPDAYSGETVPGPETMPAGLMGRLYQDQLGPQMGPQAGMAMAQGPGMGGPQGPQGQRPRPYLSSQPSPMPTTRNQYPRS